MKVNEPAYPSTRRDQASPATPQHFTGVLIAAPAALSYRGRMIVSGVYAIPESDAARIDERLHRALVASVRIGDGYRVWNPFKDAVLFEDDDERSAWGRRGYFHFDAFPGQRELHPGEYYLFVSLGAHLSNPVRVLVR